MKKFFYFLGNVITIIASFIIYSVVQQFYFYPYRLRRKLHLGNISFILLTMIITAIALLILFYLYLLQLKHRNERNYNSRPHWQFKKILLSLLGVIMLIIVSATIQLALGFNSDQTSTNQNLLDQFSHQAGNFFPVMVIFIGPVFEEFIFRGFFFNTFFYKNSNLNKWLGILFSGLIFGYVHDPGLTKYILVYWALGCVLAWVYTSTRDLRYSMLSHMIFNALGFI